MIIIVFTMFFNGGLIPNFLLVRSLKMLNTRWALLIPGLIGSWNLTIMRTYFMSLPASLEESARIDLTNRNTDPSVIGILTPFSFIIFV